MAEAKYKEKNHGASHEKLKEIEAFLKDNKTKENIIELESGCSIVNKKEAAKAQRKQIRLLCTTEAL